MKASIYLFVTAVLWGLNFHFAKFMLQESSFIEAATWRYLFGVGTLLLIGWMSLRKLRFHQISIKGVMLVGFIGLFGFILFFFKGLEYTQPVNAALIVSLNPMFTIWMSALILKTRITKFHIAGACISLFGVAVLLSQGDLSNLLALQFNRGDILILMGNIIFALHNVWVKQYIGSLSNMNFTILTNILCLIGVLIVLPLDRSGISFDHTTEFWIWSFGIGSLGTALAYLLWNKGISLIGPDRAGIFMNVVPFAAAISGWFLGEQLHLFHLVSGVVIIMGVLLTQIQWKALFQR